MTIVKKFVVLVALLKLSTLSAMQDFTDPSVKHRQEKACDGCQCPNWLLATCFPKSVKSSIKALCFIASENLLDICGSLNSLFFEDENVDAPSKQEYFRLADTNQKPYQCLAFTNENKEFLRHDIGNEQWQPSMTLDIGTYYVSFSKSGKKIITCSDSQINLYDRKTGQQLASFELTTEPNFFDEGENIKLSDDETKLFVFSRFGKRICFDVENNRILWQGEEIPNISGVTFVTNKYRDVCNIGTTVVFSNDKEKSRILIRSWNKTVVIDATTGEIIQVLWDISDNENNNTIVADFYKNSSRIIVLHNGRLNDHKSNELVDYVAQVPKQTRCPLYVKEKNALVCFTDEAYEIFNSDTKERKIIPLLRRKGAMSTTIQLVDNGKKLMLFSYGATLQTDFEDIRSFLDIYDLSTNSLIATIKCHSAPDVIRFFNSSTETLLLGLRDQVELWNVTEQSLNWSLKNQKEWCDFAAINGEGDEIIINEQQKAIVIYRKKS